MPVQHRRSANQRWLSCWPHIPTVFLEGSGGSCAAAQQGSASSPRCSAGPERITAGHTETVVTPPNDSWGKPSPAAGPAEPQLQVSRAVSVAASAGNLDAVFLVSAVGTAIFVRGHTRTCRVSTFFHRCHDPLSTPHLPGLFTEMRCRGEPLEFHASITFSGLPHPPANNLCRLMRLPHPPAVFLSFPTGTPGGAPRAELSHGPDCRGAPVSPPSVGSTCHSRPASETKEAIAAVH